MRKTKRGGDHLTKSLCKGRRTSKNESLASGHVLGDSDQGVQSGFSDELISQLSKSVVSITLYNEDTALFSCSGIAMEHQGPYCTRFLTSASLVRALNGTNEDDIDLKIEVRHEGNEGHMGFLAEFDLDHNYAVVDVHAFLDVQIGSFQCALEILPHCQILVVISRDIFGGIMTKNVKFDGDSRVSVDDQDLDSKISHLEAWEGGPLFSVDGNTVGMNLYFTAMRKTIFVPWGAIFKHLNLYWAAQQKKIGLAQSKTSKVYRFGARSIGEKSNSHREVNGDFLNQAELDLDSSGYPKLPSSMLGAGMILVNTFEEPFGDIHGKGVWRIFSKRASSNINRNVVALASFKDNKRFFACTGFFIEWNGSTVILTSASLVRNPGDENKIVGGFTIKVLVANKWRNGLLQHHSLHYNVAVVSVEDYRILRPSNTLLRWDKSFEVAAIGRCFESGRLMATSGEVVSWTGTLDCDFLSYSTCKITKVGIGGPLVSPDGYVIGMNFYDKRIGTPFLSLLHIYKILASFGTKSKVGNDNDPTGTSFWKLTGDKKTQLNRWPVPIPRWCNPDYVDEDKSDDDDELGFESKSGRATKYCYIQGKKCVQF